MTPPRKPLLQDLSEKPGHLEGDQLYEITGPDGRKARKRAHTARDAWVKARMEIGDAGYNECKFDVVKEGAPPLPDVPEVPANGKAHELSHSSALARIVVLETLVQRKDELIADLKRALGVAPGRRFELGALRAKPSPKALDKLIPKKKAKRGKTKRPKVPAPKRRVSRRASRA